MRAPGPVRAVSQAGLIWTARILATARLDLRVEGASRLPSKGPAILAVRHVHHLWDGVALLAASPRPLHLLVGLDWVGSRGLRRTMEALTCAAEWPVLVREEGLDPRTRTRAAGPASAFRAGERQPYLRRALRQVLTLLAEGRVVAVFPQGFPLVDPHLTVGRKASFLPFRPGLARFAAAATRRLGREVPVLPVGLAYEDASGRARFAPQEREAGASLRSRHDRVPRRRPPWAIERPVVWVRFGAPLAPEERRDARTLLHASEAHVRSLSGVPPA